MGELIDELNQDKNVEKMIMSDMKIGDIYKERIQVLILLLTSRFR